MEEIKYQKLISSFLIEYPFADSDINSINQKINLELLARNNIISSVTRAITVDKNIMSISFHATLGEIEIWDILTTHFSTKEFILSDIYSKIKGNVKIPNQNYLDNSQSAGENIDESNIDERVKPLVFALNSIPNCRTFSSCDGHNKMTFYVLWIHTDNNPKIINTVIKLLTLSANEIVRNYFNQGNLDFKILCGYDSWSNDNRLGYFGEYKDIPYYEIRMSPSGPPPWPNNFYKFIDEFTKNFNKKIKDTSWQEE